MASKKVSPKRLRACRNCRQLKRKCVSSENDSGPCVKCQAERIECSRSKTIVASGAKRKSEEIEDTPERESIQTNRNASSATVLRNTQNTISALSEKKPRNEKQSVFKSVGHTDSASDRPGIVCGICLQEDRRPGQERLHNAWVECEIDNCRSWYHLSCILLERRPRHMFFSLATGYRNNIFICHKCVGPRQGDHAKTALLAFADFKNAIERLKNDLAAGENMRQQTSIPELSSGKRSTQDVGQEIVLIEALTPQFEHSRVEQHQGYCTETVESLMSKIHEAIYNYDREICSANSLFSDSIEIWMEKPLKVWMLIDAGQHFTAGQEWFRVRGTARNLSRSHTPITAALRRMLKVADDGLLHIDSHLEHLSFSQVHTGLTFWFVFDLLNNEINIYDDFPNMKPLKAMRAAVANFGNARWKGSGRHVLREVQLRAWHIDEFRNELVLNRGCQGELLREMEDYLEPLARKVGKISRWSPARAAIISSAIELWSYLDAAGGQLEVIHPTIGGLFDPVHHTLPLMGEEQWHPGKNEQRKILWILHRGFRYTEIGVDGTPRVMVIKALVLVQ